MMPWYWMNKDLNEKERSRLLITMLMILCVMLLAALMTLIGGDITKNEYIEKLEEKNQLLVEKIEYQDKVIEEYRYEEMLIKYCSLSEIECNN